MSADLVYHKQGLFTAFIPQSKAGDDAWRELASQTQGTGKIFTAQLSATLSALRAAGYTVRKAEKPSEKEIDSMIEELERMGII
jgi:hypothetical protein